MIKVIRFKQFLKEQLLLEAYDYMQMFQKYFTLVEDDERDFIISRFTKSVKNASDRLTKNIRIIWYCKMLLLYYVYYSATTKDNTPAMVAYWEKLSNEVIRKTGVTKEDLINNIKKSPSEMLDRYEHYLHLNLRVINEYNPAGQLPSEVFAHFEKIEKEWAKDLAGTIPYLTQPIEDPDVDSDPDSDHTNYCFDVIDFGDGWHWVDLNDSSCDLESRAMGHCGNSGNSGSTLLSLRYLNKRRADEDSWLWEPHLTFELEEDGMLGQMKGKANDKPAPKYHKYIIPLLTHKVTINTKGESGFFIKGIRGGGYRPETNFSLDDLTEEESDNVIAINKNLDILHLVVVEFGEDRVKVSGKSNQIIITGFPLYSKSSTVLGLDDLYHEERNGISKNMVTEICKGEYDTDYYNEYVPDFSDILRGVTIAPQYVQIFEKFLDDNYEDWREENDDWEDYVSENSPSINEIEDVIYSAYRRADEQAYSDEIYKDFKSNVTDCDYIIWDGWDTFSLVFNKKKDSGLIRNLIENGNPNEDSNYSDPEVFWTWEEPYNGWSGDFSSKDFNEHLSETIHDL
jgi:hypothetical protein